VPVTGRWPAARSSTLSGSRQRRCRTAPAAPKRTAPGLIHVRLTGQTWLDPAFAIVIALLILVTAARLVMASTRVLLDETLPADEMELVRRCVVEDRGAVTVDHHELRARRAGSHRYIDLHVQVDDDLSTGETHDAAHHIAADIRVWLPNVDVLVHVEPLRRHDVTPRVE